MVTVQDITWQLMKPVKELAEWNFPFSQVCHVIFFNNMITSCIYIYIYIYAMK